MSGEKDNIRVQDSASFTDIEVMPSSRVTGTPMICLCVMYEHCTDEDIHAEGSVEPYEQHVP